MTNVVHIDKDQWNAMLHMKNCIRYYRDNYHDGYATVLDKVNSMYKEQLSKIA